MARHEASGEHRRPEAIEEGTDAERHRKIKEAALYWDGHKARLRQLLTVDYPAAIAKRNAATPEFLAVETFAKSLQKDFEDWLEKFKDDKDISENFPWGKFLDSHLDKLALSQMLVRDWSDSTPVAAGLTMADLTRQMMSDPEKLAEARSELAAAERTVFHDEGTAQKVAAMQTSDELMAYITETQARYDSAIEQELDTLGGAQTRSLLMKLANYLDAIAPVDHFMTSHNQAAAAILKECSDAENEINPSLLAEASGEDADARRLLTEWKEIQTLRQTLNDVESISQP